MAKQHVTTAVKTNLIPRFIADKYRSNETRGCFTATCLFLDIKGFTTLTERLMAHGNQGLESLATVMNRLFDPVVEAIYGFDGFIASFLGDALCALFPHRVPLEQACYAALRITHLFEQAGAQDTRAGCFSLSVTIGLARGEVNWYIVPYGELNTHFFSGNALVNSQAAQKQATDRVVLHSSLSHGLDRDKVPWEKDSQGKAVLAQQPLLKQKARPLVDISQHVIERFIAEPILAAPRSGEFRNVACLFVQLAEPVEQEELEQLVGTTAKTVMDFEGSLFPLDCQAGNIVLPIVMGAPVGHEHDVQRAILCLQALRSELSMPLQAGLTFGPVFSGFTGAHLRSQYTCIGDAMNAAARLMQLAPANGAWLDKTAADLAAPRFHTTLLKQVSVKGKRRELSVFQLNDESKGHSRRNYLAPLVGRKKELDYVNQCMNSILSDTIPAGLICISGGPGIGKSRLAYHILDYYARTMTPLILQGDRFAQGSYHAFSVMFRDLFSAACTEGYSLDQDSGFAHAFERLWALSEPDIASEKDHVRLIVRFLLGRAPAGTLSGIPPKELSQVIAQAIVIFLAALRGNRVILLLVEDMQWLDQDTIFVLEVLSQSQTPFVILATVRTSDGAQPVKAEFSARCARFDLSLERWTQSGLRRFLVQQLSGSVTPSLVTHVADRTRGIPLYTEQYIRYLQENDFLMQTPKGYALKEQAVPSLPVGLGNLLVSRIDSLPRPLKETIQIISVLGQEFEQNLVMEFLKKAADKLPRCHISVGRISMIVRQGEEEGLWQSAGATRYRFHHDLLREAAYTMQSHTRLRLLHLTAGACMENQANNPNLYTDIAFHYERAEEVEKAFAFYRKSGQFYYEASAFRQAVTEYKNALELTIRFLGKKHLNAADTCVMLAVRYLQTSHFAEAENAFNHALTIYLNQAEPMVRKVAETYSNLAQLYGDMGDLEKMDAFIQKAYEYCIMHLGEQDPVMAKIYSNKISYERQNGRFAQAHSYAVKSLELHLNFYGWKRPETAMAFNELSVTCMHLEQWDDAEKHLQQALSIWQKMYGSQHMDIAMVLHNLASINMMRGNLNQAKTLYEKTHAILLHFVGENNARTAVSCNALGVLNYNLQEYETALFYYKRALKIHFSLQRKEHQELAKIYNNIGICYLNLKQLLQAEDYLLRALALRKKYFGLHYPPLFDSYVGLAKCKIQQDDHAQAISYLKHIETSGLLQSHPRKRHANFYYLMAKTFRRDDHAQSKQYFEKAIALYKQLNMEDMVNEVAAAMEGKQSQ